jgi:peptidoglycan/LPS O-acetylase OafA/YrhL
MNNNLVNASPNFSSRIYQLDGLRGFAVAFTISFHLLNNSYASNVSLNSLEFLVSKITYYGWTGVNLFFVISGFLIGSILIKNRNSVNYFKTFYLRRFLRIIPIYYLLLFFYKIVQESTCSSSFWVNDIDFSYYILLIQNYAFGYFNSFGNSSINPTWSLSVEEQYYIVIPILIYLLNSRHLIIVSILLIVFAPIYRCFCSNWYMEYTHLFARLDAPLIGLLIAIGYSNKEFLNKKLFNWFSYFLLLFSCFALYFFFKTFNHTLIALIFGGLLIWTLFLSNKAVGYKILTLPVVQSLGKYSYFIYLYHQFINYLFFFILQSQSFPNLNTWHSYFIEILSILVTYICAIFSFRFIEGPLIRLSHKYNYR